ncbi:MAG: hypothetical protein CMJ81_11990 [Planctomycetaceae bacterium]|nr:hypothetical protein [Planctomycetaceae bacterium]
MVFSQSPQTGPFESPSNLNHSSTHDSKIPMISSRIPPALGLLLLITLTPLSTVGDTLGSEITSWLNNREEIEEPISIARRIDADNRPVV